MSDPLKNAKCEICDGAWQGVNLQGETLKCYHCSEAAKHKYAVKIMKDDLDNIATRNKELEAAVNGRREFRQMYRNLRDAIKPFADAMNNTSGRIPVEYLSLSDWHNLIKAYNYPRKEVDDE